MSSIYRSYDPKHAGGGCSCGRHASAREHDAQARQPDTEVRSNEVVEEAVLRAMFPQDARRRTFLNAVGANTVRAAIASVLPLGALQAMAQEKNGAIEKKDLKIGFIAITCAAPLIMADPLGFYKKQGLNVTLNKTAGWALIRDKMVNKEHDASHFLRSLSLMSNRRGTA